MPLDDTEGRSLPGLDVAALERWLDDHSPAPRTGPLRARRLVGGLSNLTYRVTDGTTDWALRRPPLGHALPTAHDMAREFRVLSALRGTAVPVAHPMVLCEDSAVLGAPFYLMSYVDGVVLDSPSTLGNLSHDQARVACEVLVDTLVALGDLDPAAVGLADFGRPEGFLARQVRRWTQQWQASETQPRPGLDSLVARLDERLPEQQAGGIVHGDYRLTNVIFSPDASRINAVVDWEMTALGDPLADVGLLAAYQQLGLEGGFVMPPTPPSAGFLTPDQMVHRYAERSRRDLSGIDWYVAFAYFKLAVIAEGIHCRHLQGKTVGEGFDSVGEWVPRLLASAERHIGSVPPGR